MDQPLAPGEETGQARPPARAGVRPAPGRERSRAALVPLAAVLCLIALKSTTAVLTGSLAIAASLVDSILDLVASSVNFYALRQAEVPPDDEHRWGHGKAESLSSLLQSAVILTSAGALLWQSVSRLLAPQPLQHIGAGIAVLLASSGASLLLTLYLRRAGRRYGSRALRADSAHYLSDVLTNGAALVALVAYAGYGWAWLDPVASLAIAVVLLKSAYDVARPAVDELMDRELPEEIMARITTAACSASPHVFGVHEVRSRRAGRTIVVALHLEVEGSLSFTDAHRVTVLAQQAIERELGDSITLIHPDPYAGPGRPLDPTCS